MEPQGVTSSARSGAIVGRASELTTIADLVAKGAGLITLVGPGGVGKTRVALEVAARSPLPAVFVGLSAVADSTDVAPAIARAAGWPVGDDESALDVLQRELGDQPVLLVLDTAEHLPELADELAPLLADDDRSVLLVTSRRPLHIAAERTVPIGPLPIPSALDPTSATSNESVTLLVQTARHDRPDFDVTTANVGAIVEICRRLDGLPLAIELAAARLRLIEPNRMLELLDRPLDVLRSRAETDHHQTLRATIGWSVDLLDAADRELFVTLGVFPGSFDVEAVAAVLDLQLPSVLDRFENLLDHHLVHPAVDAGDGQRRFHLLDTVRDFAVEQLEASGHAADHRGAHARWVVDLAERSGPVLESAGAGGRLARLDAEFDNVQAALGWLERAALDGDEQMSELMLRLAAPLWRYWHSRGRAGGGARWLERALATAAAGPSLPAARAWYAAGELAEQRGDLDESVRCFTEAASMFGLLGDEAGAADAWNGLGMIARTRGDLAAARAYHDRALAVFVGSGQRRREATTLHHLAAIAYFGDDLAEAERLWTETLKILSEVGDDRARGIIISNLGSVQIGLGDVRAAARAFDEAIAIGERYDDRYGLLTALANAVDARLLLGDLGDVDDLLARARLLAADGDNPYVLAMLDHHAGRLAAQRGELGDAAARLAQGWRAFVELDISASRAAALEHLGMVAAELEHDESAASMFCAAAYLRAHDGSAPLGPDADELRRWTEAVEERLERRLDAENVELAAVVDAFVIAAFGSRRPASRLTGSRVQQFGLTAREAEVAELLLDRRTDREIADALYLSRRTVTTHVSSILRKIGVTSRRDVAARLTSP
jgi:predicted ATPase/DNA-binding CsgD family transcriptional regulator